ncbi:MAG: 4-hydroxybenzoyl-CoA thioesterase [marine bacterium B5-7]|nr:MAG: 4-hydroxybenzoyl-CoA thioesterase [marine bacterium B5-7]
MLPQAQCEIAVPFYDVDSMNVVWHGHYVKYLERARCVLLDNINYGYAAMKQSGYAWPVIKLSLRYARPAIFGQSLNVIARMTEWEYRLVINYEIMDIVTGHGLCKASSTQVAVNMETSETCLGSPAILEQQLKQSGYL